uniref:SKP1-like protein 11 n=1 Tax=Tanacetum cinerariifolium TaxID=118510 RepID=A0A6L2KSF9_TANCI|nr:SKP1-like protein 11 [Tanacetum cinerariifolium]
MLKLMSKDEHVFEIEQLLVIQSVTIKALVDDDCALSVIPLDNVDAKNLTLVIEFLKKQALFDRCYKGRRCLKELNMEISQHLATICMQKKSKIFELGVYGVLEGSTTICGVCDSTRFAVQPLRQPEID